MADDCTTAAVSNPSNHNHEIEDSTDGVDSISSLPDVILQHILSFIPTSFAIRTSVLSKRWRYVWYHTPSLSFHFPKADSINKVLDLYKAPKMASFQLKAGFDHRPYINKWIELVMSRNVDNMSLEFKFRNSKKYNIPDIFYINSSLKQLSVTFDYKRMTLPSCCSVSWTSLRQLSLSCCKLSDECIAKILSGCPILESLTLYFCDELEVLDLSGSMSLRTLDIDRNIWVPGPKQIVAPHLHRLRLLNSQLPCTLVDVSSLTEAGLDICFWSPGEDLKADFLQVMVLDMLEKLKNVEKLTFGSNVLKILSLAEIRHVPFPSFKVKYMKLETTISHYIIPGLVRVLQNSPGLKKITVLTTDPGSIPGEYVDNYLSLHGLNSNQCCWSSEARAFEEISRWDPESELVALFMELIFKYSKILEKMFIKLEGYFEEGDTEELLEMIPRLSKNYNVSPLCSAQAGLLSVGYFEFSV